MKTRRSRFVVTYFLVRAADVEVLLIIRPIEHGYRIGGLLANLGVVPARVIEPVWVIRFLQDDPTGRVSAADICGSIVWLRTVACSDFHYRYLSFGELYVQNPIARAKFIGHSYCPGFGIPRIKRQILRSMPPINSEHAFITVAKLNTFSYFEHGLSVRGIGRMRKEPVSRTKDQPGIIGNEQQAS